MFGNMVKIWHEELFALYRNDVKNVTSDMNISYVPIILENINWVEELRGKEYVRQFEKQLAYGDFGYYAIIDNIPVAYGWVKHRYSKDFFFKISKECCYLCRFYTNKNYRGHNIYPCIISELINHEKECNQFYIDIEKGNKSSKKGLSKVGFKKVKDLKFFRAFRITLNKYML